MNLIKMFRKLSSTAWTKLMLWDVWWDAVAAQKEEFDTMRVSYMSYDIAAQKFSLLLKRLGGGYENEELVKNNLVYSSRLSRVVWRDSSLYSGGSSNDASYALWPVPLTNGLSFFSEGYPDNLLTRFMYASWILETNGKLEAPPRGKDGERGFFQIDDQYIIASGDKFSRLINSAAYKEEKLLFDVESFPSFDENDIYVNQAYFWCWIAFNIIEVIDRELKDSSDVRDAIGLSSGSLVIDLLMIMRVKYNSGSTRMASVSLANKERVMNGARQAAAYCLTISLCDNVNIFERFVRYLPFKLEYKSLVSIVRILDNPRRMFK